MTDPVRVQASVDIGRLADAMETSSANLARGLEANTESLIAIRADVEEAEKGRKATRRMVVATLLTILIDLLLTGLVVSNLKTARDNQATLGEVKALSGFVRGCIDPQAPDHSCHDKQAALQAGLVEALAQRTALIEGRYTEAISHCRVILPAAEANDVTTLHACVVRTLPTIPTG